MAGLAGPFRLLGAGPGRFVCYSGSGGTVCATDGCDVWAGQLGASPPLACRCQPEEHSTKLREALGRGAALLSLGEGSATLQLLDEAPCMALHLFKLPATEARSQLQELVFSMAGCIESLERRLEAVLEAAVSPCSPVKNSARSQQLFVPDPSPSKNRGAGSALPAKRKVPGESLINPGFKSKKAPSGVDFEDS